MKKVLLIPFYLTYAVLLIGLWFFIVIFDSAKIMFFKQPTLIDH